MLTIARFDPTLRRIPAVYSWPTVTAELIPLCWVQIITLCALLSFSSSSPLLCQFYSPVHDLIVKFHSERKFAKWDLFAANSRKSSRQTVRPKFITLLRNFCTKCIITIIITIINSSNYNHNNYYDNDDNLIALISVHCNSSKTSDRQLMQ
jgi:hypothetical protein